MSPRSPQVLNAYSGQVKSVPYEAVDNLLANGPRTIHHAKDSPKVIVSDPMGFLSRLHQHEKLVPCECVVSCRQLQCTSSPHLKRMHVVIGALLEFDVVSWVIL